MKRQKSILLLQNNSTASQPVTLFTTSPNQSGPVNGINYGWDISSLTLLLLMSVQIQVAPAGGTFVTLTAPITASTPQGIANALNTLNIGFFYVSVTGGTTLIRTSNRLFRFATLVINQSLSHWNATGTLQVNNLTVTLAQVEISDVPSGTILGFFNGSGAPPYAVPLNSSATYTFPQLAPGDTINAFVTVQPFFGPPFAFVYVIRQNGVIILSGSAGGFSLSLNFPYVQDAVYDFQFTIN